MYLVGLKEELSEIIYWNLSSMSGFIAVTQSIQFNAPTAISFVIVQAPQECIV